MSDTRAAEKKSEKGEKKIKLFPQNADEVIMNAKQTKGEKVNGTITNVTFGIYSNVAWNTPCCTVELTDGRTAYWYTDEIILNQKQLWKGSKIAGFVYQKENGELTLKKVKKD